MVKTSLPVSAYSSEPFSAAGLKLLDGTNTFLAANKLSKGAVDIDAWRVTG